MNKVCSGNEQLLHLICYVHVYRSVEESVLDDVK